MSRVGILGGSFNPPHIGHLICGRMAAEQLGLARVLVIPLAQAPHREMENDPGPRARLELCRLAVDGDPVLGACDVEVARGGESFTVDTLEVLRDNGTAVDPALILGADAAAGLAQWRAPGRVVELASLAIAPRSGGVSASDAAETVAAEFPEARVEAFAMPEIGISSSQVRTRVASGLSIRDMVPPAVADLIAAEGWYGAGEAQ